MNLSRIYPRCGQGLRKISIFFISVEFFHRNCHGQQIFQRFCRFILIKGNVISFLSDHNLHLFHLHFLLQNRLLLHFCRCPFIWNIHGNPQTRHKGTHQNGRKTKYFYGSLSFHSFSPIHRTFCSLHFLSIIISASSSKNKYLYQICCYAFRA